MSITGARTVVPGVSALGERATGRQAWRLLWTTDRRLSALVIAWVVAGALMPGLVVTALGVVVGLLPGAIRNGLGSGAGHRLILALGVAALIYALSLVLDPIGNALGTAASARITGDLQGRLLAAVSRPVGVGHLEDAQVLDRLARAEGSLTGYFPGDAPVTWVGTLASRISGVIGCVVVSVYVWWLGLLLLVLWLAVRRFVLAAVVRQATELRGQTTVLRRAWYFIGVGTKARDAKEIRVFGLAGFVANRFRREYREAMRTAVGGLRDLHRRAALAFVAVLGGYAVALLVIADDARTHAIGVGTLAVLLPMLAVTMTTGSVNYDDITLAWTLAGLPDVDRLESDLVAQDLPGARPVAGRPRRSVRLEAVSFRYPTGTTDVLDGVDLELAAGTSTAIVGVNGAGKSTLVSLLSRLRDPTAGRITVDGTDVRELDPAAWQRTVAIMPQEPTHYPVSAYDNIAFGALEHRDDRAGVEEAARLAGFADVVPTLPDGWDTLLARELPGGVNLSGGQWQRLALARALFATRHGARLLVLDEPTAALDVRGEAEFYGRFLDITAGLTTVIISHRFATVRRADVICVLDGGVIAERGTHDELVALGGTYARMYQVQAARFGGDS
ncbi:MAG TPA: ABC transporter ATP-binding protein [Pseudonocardiaceae bacterium]|nr:ABC transporter ATP-binding protein [Pseudonocardiaceae bacterium]